MSWQIDPAHSHVQFTGRHMMIATVRGHFERFGGTVDFDEANPENTLVDVEFEAASLNTGNADRDNHLRSPDFLDAQNYPYLYFKSTRVESLGGNRGRLYGDLTIRNVTRPVRLDVEYLGQSRSPWGTVNAGFTASTKINRKEWGLTWNVALETGGFLVSDEIGINIELELVQQPEPAREMAEVAA
jgi:polyisoprenoid-binding protein YceI